MGGVRIGHGDAPPVERPRLLVVHEGGAEAEAVRQVAQDFFATAIAKTALDALTMAASGDYSVIAVTHAFAAGSGLRVIEEAWKLCPSTSFLLISNDSELDLRADARSVRYVTGIVHQGLTTDELFELLVRACELAEARSKPPSSAPSLNVLLVEDHAPDVELIERALSPEGLFTLWHCDRLRNATELLAEKSFDAVLTDLSLPDACGLDAVTRIRAANADVPIVVMSGMADETLALKAIESGAQNYLIKSTIGYPGLPLTIRCAIGLRNQEVELANRALADPLTGLGNRRALLDAFISMRARARRNGTLLGVLVLDLDDLKLMNDSYGHAAGDRALKAVATRLKGVLRTSDTIARVGGDEFVVLVDDVASAVDAEIVVSRVARAVTGDVHVAGCPCVTVSIGFALFSRDGTELAELVEAADHAMYANKRRRRPALGQTGVAHQVAAKAR